MIILADDSAFTVAQTLNNFRLGQPLPVPILPMICMELQSFVEHKHWGCRGPLIIDARIKPHHAPVLVPDPLVSKKVDRLFAKGGELYNWQ